jgi:hypothetical protein
MHELKENIQHLNETQTHKINFWSSPYMMRSEIKEKLPVSSKGSKRLNGLEACVCLYQELIRADVEKNVRLKIFSSGSQRLRTPKEDNCDDKKVVGSNSFMREDSRGRIGYQGIEDEKISVQNLKDRFNDNFNKKQWDRLLFSLNINLEETRMTFDKFLLFFRIFLNKSATYDQKYDFFLRSFSYPHEKIDKWKQENIETTLKIVLNDRKEELLYNKIFIQTLGRQIFEMVMNKNKFKESVEEIIELVFLRKKL